MEREKLIALVQKAQQGNAQALDALFTEFYNDVYYFALKTVKDEDLAYDITQETFVEIIRSIGKLEEPAAFVTWMKRIAYFQCTRHFSKQKEVLVEEDEDGNSIFDTLADESEGSVPSHVLEQEEFRQTILSMINQLTEQQRSAVMLYYFDELSVTQIAEIQGVSEGTVKSRLNYARKAIKKSVEDYEKKHNLKLHSFAPLPLLLLFFGKETLDEGKAGTLRASVMETAGISAKTAAGAAAGTAASTGAGSLMGKIAIGVVAAVVTGSVVVGGVAAAVVTGGALLFAGSDQKTHQHQFETVQQIEPSCRDVGLRVERCDCGEEKIYDIPPTGNHNFVNIVAEIPATCMSEGQKITRCSCGEEKVEIFPVNTYHTYDILLEKKDATCEADGYTICTCVCGRSETTILPALGHQWGEWEEITTPGLLNDGKASHTCSACAATETKILNSKLLDLLIKIFWWLIEYIFIPFHRLLYKIIHICTEIILKFLF